MRVREQETTTETNKFDRVTATFAQARSRRSALGVLGVAAFAASGVSLLSSSEGEATRRKGKKKKKEQPQQPRQPVLVPDATITLITVVTTAEAAHDDIVVQFTSSTIPRRPALILRRVLANRTAMQPAISAPSHSATPSARRAAMASAGLHLRSPADAFTVLLQAHRTMRRMNTS